MNNENQKSGFVMIALILGLVIIVIIFGVYYGGSGSGGKSVQKTGQDAIEKTKENNATQIQQNLEIQNELNSIDR